MGTYSKLMISTHPVTEKEDSVVALHLSTQWTFIKTLLWFEDGTEIRPHYLPAH